MKPTLKISTIRNLGYNVTAKIVIFVLSLSANIILARNLDSGDYGLVGFAMVFIAFLNQFCDFGISSAVVQKDDLDDEDLYTAFTMKFALGLVAFSLSYLLAILAAYSFGHPGIKSVILILCFNFIISSFGFAPYSLLTRALDYKKIMIPQIGTAVVYAGLSITLALQGYKYWSIVIASVGSALSNAVLLYLVKPTRLRFRFSPEKAKGLFAFGSKLFLNGLIVFAIFNADNYLIGSVLGATALGYYSVAFTWGAMGAVMLSEMIHNVLFPTFSRIQNESGSIRSAYLKVLDYGAFLGIMINLSLFVFSTDFLFFLLGKGTDKWMAALPILRILCLYGILRAVLEPIGPVLTALGRPSVLTRATLISGSLQLIFLYPALKLAGIEGVAALITLTYAVQYLVYFPYLNKYYGISYSNVWAALKPSILSGILVVTVYLMFTSPSLTFGAFLTKALFFVLFYVLSYGFFTRWRPISEVREVLRELLLLKN